MIPDVIVAVVVTLIVNEMSDISPWLAVRVARWAAGKIYASNPEMAARRAEDWQGQIDESIPTKISKLCFGLGMGCAGLWCMLVGYAPTVVFAVGRAVGNAAAWTYVRGAELLFLVAGLQLMCGPSCHQSVTSWLEGTGAAVAVAGGWVLFGLMLMGVGYTFKVAFLAAAGGVKHLLRRGIAS
jgi:hypothetical protein